MFLGEYLHSIDAKGRLAVPHKFRSSLEAGAIITRGLEGSLFLFTLEEWTKLADKITSLPLAQANARAFQRLMLAGAMDLTIDNQGRILIPEYLRIFASIKKEVIFAGLYNRIELWSEDAWRNYVKKTEASSEEIAERLGSLGI